MANNGRIVIDVDINGHVKGFEQAIQQATNKLATMPLVKDNPLAKAIEKAKREMADLNKLAAKGISSKGDQSKLENQYERVKRSIEEMASAHQRMANMSSKDFKKLIDKDVIVGYDEAKKAVDEYAKSLEQLTAEKRKLAGKQGAQTRRANQMAKLEGSTDEADVAKLDTLREKFNKAKIEIDTMSNSINTKAVQALEKLKQSLESMGLDTSNITDVKTALESVEDQLINTDKIVEDTQQSFKDNDAIIEQFRTILKNLGYDITEVGNEFDTASDKMDLTNTISRNIKNFFSLTNAIYLFRRAIMSSFNTVKELDAVMTETAVVTDFSVSDMWDKLPEYTKMANELGATTKGAYETATLYYQQGLKTNEVMAVSAETMKMARIAGLDYATATDYMTAALRGFNMEINTDSAERVNDVYSRLAAVTASNTQEISVAMTKVASLAHNANMEFETTAAFLAQIIETTRESAETAGTALKTVVARFTEVKKLYNEGELLGTDEEGEEIDVNKVSTALRSAGIDMNKYFTGQVGLDDIFMELASKWDSLDKVQQRYIATMAAGSRQQSRFIAMMSNYQRTLELVGEAENSAGAEQKQFEKTMESLEATLNRLKNAWDTFLMGIANSDAIKWVLNLLTDLLTKLNEIISAVSGESGFTKFFTSMGLALSGGAIIKGGLNILSNGMATILGTTKKVNGEAVETLSIFSKIANLDLDKSIDKVAVSFDNLYKKINQFKITDFITQNWVLIASITAIAVAIWAVVKAYEKFKKTTSGYKIEKMSEGIESTNEKLSTLNDYITSINQKELNLNSKIKGTKEWQEAVNDLNTEVRELLELYPELSKYVTIKDGHYVIDWEGIKQEQQTQQAQQINSQRAVYFEEYEDINKDFYLKKLQELRGAGAREGVNIETLIGDIESLIKAFNEGKINYEDLGKYGLGKLTEEQFRTMLIPLLTDWQIDYNDYINKRDLAYQSVNSYMTPEQFDIAVSNEVERLNKEYNGDLTKLNDLGKALFGEEQWNVLSNGIETFEEAVIKIAQITAGNFNINEANLAEGGEGATARLAYTHQYESMNLLQQQQYSTNLNAIQAAGIQFNSDVFNQAANYTKENKDIQELIDSLINLLDLENTHAKNMENLQSQYDIKGIEAYEKEIDNLTTLWEKDSKEIKKLQTVLKDTPTDYEKITEAAKEALDSDITEDFVKENIDLFYQLSAGGEEAQSAFEQLLFMAYLSAQGIEANSDAALNVKQALDLVNGYNLEVGSTADFTPVMDALIDLLGSAEAVDNFLNAMNYETQWYHNGEQVEPSVIGRDVGHESQLRLQNYEMRVVKTGLGNTNNFGSPSGSGGSGGGGGGGSNSNPDRWLNPYDKFYNLTEQINEALRQREKLERQYDRILKNRWSLQKDIQGNTQARLASLKQEIEMNKRLLAGRQEQLDAVLNEKFLDEDKNIRTFRDFGVAKYANYNTARGTVEIDWEGLERLSGTTDTQLGSVIEDFVKRLEELQDQWEDTDKVIEDLEDEVQEILDINKEEYLSFEQRVFDAIVDREQKLIDGYSDLSETISNDNEEVLNALSESIDLSRQIRDNTKTEEEIAEKEARLAYLRRDTSGANDLAIKQLEKELEQARESYGDTLIDQELDRLSQANEDAAKQRERQIEIMQAQLDWQQKVGFFWNEVINLLQNNYGQTDEGIAKELVDLLEATDAFSGMSEFQKADWLQKLHTEWLESESGHASWRLSEAKAASMGESGKESNYSISADQTTAGKALRYDYDRDMWLDEDEGWYTGVSYNAESNLFDYTGYSSKASRDAEAAAQAAKAQAEATKRSSVGVGSYINASGAPIYTSAYGGSPLTQYFGNDPKYLVLDDYGSSWMVRWHGLSSGITGFFRKGDVRGYKTGGLVNTTGPAWLDGTPQRPEFVLNADQTQAFMKLVDKLGNGTGAGDNYFDVNIVVDQISSDYDVDRLVDRIKQKITEDAQYRNVNAINWIR